LYLLLKELTSFRSLWYPLGLFAFAAIMIKYSSELKQYMSDILIILSLILLSLKVDIDKTKKGRFVLIWLIAGSIGIWGAMPSVFALAGIGCYYLYGVISGKDYKRIGTVVVVGLLWLLQFVVYYWLILKPQIESNYLQNFHSDYFLFATPETRPEWGHNWDVIKTLIQEAGGYWIYAFWFNIALIVIGIIVFLIRDMRKALLVLITLFATLAAAALNQYSLIPRVALFTMPLILILIGYALNWLMHLKWKPLSIVLFGAGACFIYMHNMIKLAWEPLQTEQITDAMEFVMHKQITAGNQLYISNGARPAFIYYTRIHPGKEKWSKIKDAHLLWWDAVYSNEAKMAKGKFAFIFTSISADELNEKRTVISQYSSEIGALDKQGCHAYVYLKSQ